MSSRRSFAITTLGCVCAGLVFSAFLGCGDSGGASGTNATNEPGSTATAALKGDIKIDGSSTVYPITEAVAETFMDNNSGVRITVGVSGTGGGFKKFTAGETDISNASRPIDAAEIAEAEKNGISFIEVPVAFDGLSVVVNPANDWCDHLTVEELKRIWEPGSKITNWSQIRPGFPNVPLKLYGPGTDSGTFDYFTKAIVGTEKASRNDFQASEDDNVLVTGVAGDRGALGYFGYAYFVENADKLKVLGVDAGNGPIKPSNETIENGTYIPLNRPEFIYVNAEAAKRPEVIAFVHFYLSPEGRKLVSTVGYIPLPAEAYDLAKARFDAGTTGSVFSGRKTVGVTISELLKLESE